MIRCQEGHFYDPSKHGTCPWCAKPVGVAPAPDPGIGKTAGAPPQPDELFKTSPVGGAPPAAIVTPAVAAPQPSPSGPTRRVLIEKAGVDPVVGWLVCIGGPDKGRDYRLHSEKNFIGRSSAMDVVIAGDDSVSRERHAVLTFEPKKKMFWLLPGDASGLVYLNGEIVYTPTALAGRDIVELGRTKLMLIPFVDDQFTWQE